MMVSIQRTVGARCSSNIVTWRHNSIFYMKLFVAFFPPTILVTIPMARWLWCAVVSCFPCLSVTKASYLDWSQARL